MPSEASTAPPTTAVSRTRNLDDPRDKLELGGDEHWAGDELRAGLGAMSRGATGHSVAFSTATDGMPGVWAMGRNTEGQLLNGAASTAEMPHRCEALLAQVDASSRAATALREAADRDQATGGRSGEGAAQEVEKHDGRVADIACGRHFTVVLLAHGAVLVGGDNSCGQLGLGTTALGKPAKGSHEATQVHGICSGA